MPGSSLAPHSRAMSRRHLVLAYALLSLSAGFVVWGLAPDFSAEGATDRMIEPKVSDEVRLAAGLCALLVAVGAVVAVRSPAGRALRRHLDAWTWVPVAVAGAYAGFTYHAATAAVIGANIGGAMLVLLGMALVPALLVVSAASAWRGRRRRNRADACGELLRTGSSWAPWSS